MTNQACTHAGIAVNSEDVAGKTLGDGWKEER